MMADILHYIDIDFDARLPSMIGELGSAALSGDPLWYDYEANTWKRQAFTAIYGWADDDGFTDDIIDVIPISPFIDYTAVNQPDDRQWSAGYFDNKEPFTNWTQGFNEIVQKPEDENWLDRRSVYWNSQTNELTTSFGEGNRTEYFTRREVGPGIQQGIVESRPRIENGRWAISAYLDPDGVVLLDSDQTLDHNASLPSPYNSSSTFFGLFWDPASGKYCSENNLFAQGVSGGFYVGTVVTRNPTAAGFSRGWNSFDTNADEYFHFISQTAETGLRSTRGLSAWNEILWHQQPVDDGSIDMEKWILRMPIYEHGLYLRNKVTYPFAIKLATNYDHLFPTQRKPTTSQFIVWSYGNSDRFVPQLCEEYNSSMSNAISAWEWTPQFSKIQWDGNSGAEQERTTRLRGDKVCWHTGWNQRTSGEQTNSQMERIGIQPETVKYYALLSSDADEHQAPRARFYDDVTDVSASDWSVGTYVGSGGGLKLFQFDLNTTDLGDSDRVNKYLRVESQVDITAGSWSRVKYETVANTSLATGLSQFHGRNLHPCWVGSRSMTYAASGFDPIIGDEYIGGYWNYDRRGTGMTVSLSAWDQRDDLVPQEIIINISESPELSGAFSRETRVLMERWMTLTDHSSGGNESDPWWHFQYGTVQGSFVPHQFFYDLADTPIDIQDSYIRKKDWRISFGDQVEPRLGVVNTTPKWMKVRQRVWVVRAFESIYGHWEECSYVDGPSATLSPSLSGDWDWSWR